MSPSTVAAQKGRKLRLTETAKEGMVIQVGLIWNFAPGLLHEVYVSPRAALSVVTETKSALPSRVKYDVSNTGQVKFSEEDDCGSMSGRLIQQGGLHPMVGVAMFHRSAA